MTWAHVVVEGETSEPTTVKGLTEADWEIVTDIVGGVEELDIVSAMSLHTAVFALQQIELHLGAITVEEGRELSLNEVIGVMSRIRILTVSTLVSLGVLSDLPTGEDGKPMPVELPNMGIEDQQKLLRDLTAERKSNEKHD